MAESKSILHELYVFSEWKPEPEYLQKPDNILPENISSLWRWLKFFGPKKSLIDSVTAHKERQQKWHIALGDEGKVLAVLTDNILEIRTKRSEYATIAARTTVARDAYAQWRKIVWSPDCSFLALAYGNGIVSFFDLTASNLFNIPSDCSRPGGLECSDNTHAVSDIIFMPLRVKDTKWNWEVVVVTYDGKLRGYLVSATEGFKLHHTFQFPGGVAAACYCELHATLYVAGVPRVTHEEAMSAAGAGVTAWRALSDEPFYKLSVVSDDVGAGLANDRLRLYLPIVFNKNFRFIVRMSVSPGTGRLACVHCNGDVSLWRLPALRLERYVPLAGQPQHALPSPLAPPRRAPAPPPLPADINWWTEEEIIISRFTGAVTVCELSGLQNILGKKPEFFQGTPQVTCAHDGVFMVLECESNVLPAKKSRSDESMEVVKAHAEVDDSMLGVAKELIKSVLYAITDMETFQPRPKKITVLSRVYRLLGVKSTTPNELFSRKIESGKYSEALALAETFDLDSDLVYQQQWRKNPVSTDAIQKYLSKVSKKIWAVHQCVDRLPESTSAAWDLLAFGLQLTQIKIVDEINKDLPEEEWKCPDDMTLEDLNSYTSELLRCRHVMLFYKERLALYEAILHSEKSAYAKDEYDRLRSNSIVHSAMEIAKEGRIEALTCLWPFIKSLPMQLAVLDKIPETLCPLIYQHLLPTKVLVKWFQENSPIKMIKWEHENDWCRKEIFRPIWSSNWSEDTSPDTEPARLEDDETVKRKWYCARAKEIESRTGLVSHALHLITLADVTGLELVRFHLHTLDTLVYDINIESVSLEMIENLTALETCKLLMSKTSHKTFILDLKQFVLPFLTRYQNLEGHTVAYIDGLMNYLESISAENLSYILLFLQSPKEFRLDVSTHLDLVERCLFANTSTEQLDIACDLLDTILKETDGSISNSSLLKRCSELERLVAGSGRLAWRGVRTAPRELRALSQNPPAAEQLLTRVARSVAKGDQKPTQQDWENLLMDLLQLQSTVLDCITTEQCYEIYASSLLTSGDAASIRLAGDVLTVSPAARRGSQVNFRINYNRSVELVAKAAEEYFNSASSLTDPDLELAKCCLLLIEDGNKKIEEELDLIAALPILKSFKLELLPIQVRLYEDRLRLIENCMDLNPNAYQASHKLLKLAKLLRVAGDDEQMREGEVLGLVCEHALRAGAAGGGAAGAAARRLVGLRHARAAPLLARVAQDAHAHADTAERARLLAAAAVHVPPPLLWEVVEARLKLELENLQQMGTALVENHRLEARWPSEDEFSDAITTPVIEKKDLVPPKDTEKEVPLLDNLLDSLQSKTLSSGKAVPQNTTEKTIHCQEFYRSLYPEHDMSTAYYCFDRFSIPDDLEGESTIAHSMIKWFYIQDCLQNGKNNEMEMEVVQWYAQELVHNDSPLCVGSLLRGGREGPGPGVEASLVSQASHAAVSAALYAVLIACNSTALRDLVYLADPKTLACITLNKKNASQKQFDIIRQCIEKLSGISEVDKIRKLGLTVNGLLFNADQDYRKEIIYRLAKSIDTDRVKLACSLALKYELDAVEVWLQHALAAPARVTAASLPPTAFSVDGINRIRDVLWPTIRGNAYAALINFFTILKDIDDKTQMYGLAVTEHIKILKKAKAVSQELDYKLLLEAPRAERLRAHVLAVARPDNVRLLAKLLRALPPPAFRLPLSVPALYAMWLTSYFFSVGGPSSSKRWMQQWRQCASYFNKLPKEELLKFVAATCFSKEAIMRVPSGTRILMILQAVEYCQQEQEIEIKSTKNEQTWAQVGQELSRWARFLENFHSGSVQAIIEASDAPRDPLWMSLEMSHGSAEGEVGGGDAGEGAGGGVEGAVGVLSGAALGGVVRAPALGSLLHCLHVPADACDLMRDALQRHVHTLDDMQTLVNRVTQFHKEGIKFPEEFLEEVLDKAAEYGLPPHKQLGLLSLSQRSRVRDGDDLIKIAHSTVDLFKTEWADVEYAQELTEESLLTAEGRRAAFDELVERCDSWQRKKALVDVLACWPHTQCDGRSLHCDYLYRLLSRPDELKESLVLIKLLLRRPILADEEVKWLAENADGNAVINTVWILLLNKCESSEELVRNLVLQHKEFIQKEEIEDDLIKELLDQGMFTKLVSTPLYSPIINYIMNTEASGIETATYNVKWATEELSKANYLAEAGHLHLLANGTPSALRGFSQAVLYCRNMFK